MNLYHIKKQNILSIETKKPKIIYVDLNNTMSLGDLLFIICNGFALSYDYNMAVRFINNNTQYNMIKSLEYENLPTQYTTITEPREYFYNKIFINNNNHNLIKGKYHSYKYFYHHIDRIKKILFSRINELVINSIESFKNVSEDKKIILVYINNDTLIRESYYAKALNKFFLINNKNDYKIFIFTENININNWQVFKNYNCKYYNGNEEKLFLLMIQCDHFIITNSSLPLLAYYFRNNMNATITFPPIWVDDIFNYNDMILDENNHISIINKLNNTHIINLEERIDRKINSLNQVKKISYNPKIFKAHKNKEGRLGCSLSHIDLLLKAIELNLPYIVICEDDIQIENEHYVLYCIDEIMNNYEWDVICLGGYINDININRFINKLKESVTTTIYIVNKNYYTKLLDNFVEGKDLLAANFDLIENNLDVYWIKLQSDNWYTTNKKYIYQRIDFSDIGNTYNNSKDRFNLAITNFINNKIIPLDYLYDIPIFNINNIKEVENIHPFFLNYKTIIINIKCIMINKEFIKYSLDLLKDNEYDLIKLQSTYNEKTFDNKISNDMIYTKLIISKINYNNIAFLLNNYSLKKIIIKNNNLKMGKLIKPIFLGENDKLWLEYYNNINNNII